MKRSFLLALCLSAAAAFAGVYDIADFTAKDAVMSDNQVFASSGELSTASVDEAAAVPSGNVVLRQKFAQESGLNAYQLYIGQVGDLSSMTDRKSFLDFLQLRAHIIQRLFSLALGLDMGRLARLLVCLGHLFVWCNSQFKQHSNN